MPASRNESQTAAPATVPASPSSAKMPAPTIAPMPRKAAPRTVTSGHDLELARCVVEAFSTLRGHGDDVFDADAEASGKIHAGLDREAHARLELVRLALDHVRRLVGGEPDAVTGSVDEVVPVTR